MGNLPVYSTAYSSGKPNTTLGLRAEAKRYSPSQPADEKNRIYLASPRKTLRVQNVRLSNG
jgi:hypothetical protein